MDQIKCPVCGGSGCLNAPLSKAKNDKSRLRNPTVAKLLRKKGHSIREIMNIMGYKSTVSVQLLLNKKVK